MMHMLVRERDRLQEAVKQVVSKSEAINVQRRGDFMLLQNLEYCR
jgi:hypothetical protein